jgi:replicative DNA helicase
MSQQFDLRECDSACTGCIKSYKSKFQLKHGDKFSVACSGIPKNYTRLSLPVTQEDPENSSMDMVLDPVTWAAQLLDWHCLDPDGSVWKRKTKDGSLMEVPPFKGTAEDIHRCLNGKSPFNRPQQSTMLRCTSKYKVFRIGRQFGKTTALVISILFNAFTHSDFNIVILAPYLTQIELIFKRIERFLILPTVSSSIRRNVKAPNFTIELYNNSSLKGFTTGVRSAGNADAVRGQRADMLVFDEADYLAEADIASALAVITNQPNATVWMSSTPTGRRAKFYDLCQSKNWKEFHYPSHINPNYNDEMDALYRETLGPAYKQEVLAEWGEQQEGVYQQAFIEAAMSDYEYNQMRHENRWIYCMGVDWNDTKIGTTIVVVGFNPADAKFYVVHKRVVSREGWTQLMAVEVILNLNKIWLPSFIYVDKGFGTTQIEVLRKIGFDALSSPAKGASHPDSRIPRILVAYDSGGKIETRDPFTKVPMQKHAKPFLVQNSVRRFEAAQMKFPKSDKQLEAELSGYIVDRVTPTGQPVYIASEEKVGDHTLDALNLALVAFTLQMSDLGKPTYDVHIAFTGQFGEKTEAKDEGFSLVIKQDPKKTFIEEKTKKRPDSGRDQGISPDQPSLFRNTGLPAANVNRSGTVGLWAWPGFSRDEGPPKPRRIQGPSRRKNI